MKHSIGKCLGFLADNAYQGEPMDEDTRCRLGHIVCKAILRDDTVDWDSEYGDCMASPGDIIIALYHWGHDWGHYPLGCAAGRIYTPGIGGGLEPDTMEAMLYSDWTYSG